MSEKRKRSGPGRPPVANRKRMIASLKGTDEFKAWFEELVGFLRLPSSTALEHGLISLARDRGFDKEPPKR